MYNMYTEVLCTVNSFTIVVTLVSFQANDAIQSDEGSRHASTPDRASLNRADGKPHAVYKFKNPNFEVCQCNVTINFNSCR